MLMRLKFHRIYSTDIVAHYDLLSIADNNKLQRMYLAECRFSFQCTSC